MEISPGAIFAVTIMARTTMRELYRKSPGKVQLRSGDETDQWELADSPRITELRMGQSPNGSGVALAKSKMGVRFPPAPPPK